MKSTLSDKYLAQKLTMLSEMNKEIKPNYWHNSTHFRMRSVHKGNLGETYPTNITERKFCTVYIYTIRI